MISFQKSSSTGKGLSVDVYYKDGIIYINSENYNFLITEKERSESYKISANNGSLLKKHYNKLYKYKSVSALLKYAKENNIDKWSKIAIKNNEEAPMMNANEEAPMMNANEEAAMMNANEEAAMMNANEEAPMMNANEEAPMMNANEEEIQRNIKVNYTNFNGKRTSTTIKWTLANVFYRETKIEEYKKTIYERENHIEAVKKEVQEFVNEEHKEEYETISTWEDQEMIESSLLEAIITTVKIKTIEKIKSL